MKLYEYIKGENERTAKLFGFPIMEQTSDYMTAQRIQNFFGGIISTFKVNDPYDTSSEKDIKVLGHSIIKRIEKDNYRRYYINGIEVKKLSLLKEFKKQYFKYFDKQYDDIYILRANSGETYLTLTYILDVLIKRNGSKNPLLVATLPYHVDMIKMIYPQIPYIYTKKLRINLAGDSFQIDNFRFFLLFASPHFKQVEYDIKHNPLGEHHYFKSILKRVNITNSDISMRKITIPFEAEQSMLNKIAKTGLNIDNFVFLAPEAQSCKLYDEDFWCELINQFQARGYDVFINLVDNEVKLKEAVGYKTCYLTFAEAFALAKRSQRIVSLRSGFTEFLLQTGVPIDVLYTKFRHRHFFDDMDIYHVMSGFGITKIPFVNKSKIREFNMYELSPKECIETILNI